MAPFDDHPARARAVELFDDHLHEFGLIEVCLHDDPLPLLDVDAHFREQFCIAFELRFIHTFPPLGSFSCSVYYTLSFSFRQSFRLKSAKDAANFAASSA